MSDWSKQKGSSTESWGWSMPEGANPMRVMQVASAYWDACALHAGTRLNLFNLLDGESKDLDSLTAATGADRRCLGALLSALVSMDFLERDGDMFSNSVTGATFLAESSKYFQGGIVGMFENWYEAWGGLYNTVMTGKPSALMHQAYSDEETHDYMMGMHNRALSQSGVLTDMFDLTGKKKIMDVGCGPATFAVKFCERYEGLNAVAMDREQNIGIAQKIVDQFNMGDRVQLLVGDYNNDSLGSDNDAMLLSSMTNQESSEKIRALLKKCYESMSADGVIMVQEQLLHADKRGPKLAALIGVNQIINTELGSSYSTAEMEEILRDVGFVEVSSQQMAPPSPFIMVSGYKR